MFRIDPESIEIIQADRLDPAPPLRVGSIRQDLVAFSTAARRLSISAILSAILLRICVCFPIVSCSPSMVVRALMSRSPIGALATGQETRRSSLSALADRALPWRSMRASSLSACWSWTVSLPLRTRCLVSKLGFFASDRMRPAMEAAFLVPGAFGDFALPFIYPSYICLSWPEIRRQIDMGFRRPRIKTAVNRGTLTLGALGASTTGFECPVACLSRAQRGRVFPQLRSPVRSGTVRSGSANGAAGR